MHKVYKFEDQRCLWTHLAMYAELHVDYGDARGGGFKLENAAQEHRGCGSSFSV